MSRKHYETAANKETIGSILGKRFRPPPVVLLCKRFRPPPVVLLCKRFRPPPVVLLCKRFRPPPVVLLCKRFRPPPVVLLCKCNVVSKNFFADMYDSRENGAALLYYSTYLLCRVCFALKKQRRLNVKISFIRCVSVMRIKLNS